MWYCLKSCWTLTYSTGIAFIECVHFRVQKLPKRTWVTQNCNLNFISHTHIDMHLPVLYSFTCCCNFQGCQSYPINISWTASLVEKLLILYHRRQCQLSKMEGMYEYIYIYIHATPHHYKIFIVKMKKKGTKTKREVCGTMGWRQ